MWLEIAGRRVDAAEPLFTIAEIGLNHGGSIDKALALVDAAADAGASAVKVQTLVAEELVASTSIAPAHVKESSMREFFRRFELDLPAYRRLKARAAARGLAFIATPFSYSAVDLLEDAGVDAYKIASGDVTYLGLIERCTRTGKPLIISTGMSNLVEVHQAVSAARAAGARQLALLHCVSAYPVPPGDDNLLAIETLRHTFDVVPGLSDHSADAFAVPMAVALGAAIYERHLILDGDDGVDAAVSSRPAEFANLVRAAARARAALGTGKRTCAPAEAMNRTASRRSLRAARQLPEGHVVAPGDIAALRPGDGLSPLCEGQLIGTVLPRAVAEGEPFVDDDLSLVRGRVEVA